MANIKGGEKRARQAIKLRAKNRAERSKIVTLAAKLIECIAAKDKAKATETYNAFSSLLDKSAKKGIIKANTASRKKSRMALKVKALA